MRLSTHRSIIALATIRFLGVMAALVLLSDPGVINAQSTPPFIVEGKVVVNGRPAPDGSSIIAYIDGRDVAEAEVGGGTFVMAVPEQPGQSLKGRLVEFAVKGSNGTLFDFAQKTVWKPGGRAELRLELNADSELFGSRPTTFVGPFVVEGKVIIDGNIAPEGTRIAAFISGNRMKNIVHIRGGKFKLTIAHPLAEPEPAPQLQDVEFIHGEVEAPAAEAKKKKPQPIRAQPSVGRNEPCPCGSGKKYKKCCGLAKKIA